MLNQFAALLQLAMLRGSVISAKINNLRLVEGENALSLLLPLPNHFDASIIVVVAVVDRNVLALDLCLDPRVVVLKGN